MPAAALLSKHPDPTAEQVDAAMTNLCRCATYPRIRAGIRRAVELIPPPPSPPAEKPKESVDGEDSP
jgi:isoquinoline 1-oxidoreductase alpha subunit